MTTLHANHSVVLDNALISSDNVYFAKAALKIGTEGMEASLLHLGFQEELPFEILMGKSQYSNTEIFETEIQLAGSGYGQGQILINPLHMACIYTAFCNMAEDVKGRGGSGYVVGKDKQILESWLNRNANGYLDAIRQWKRKE